MKIVLDETACQGHGRCYELAPELFADDERGHSQVTNAEPDDALVDTALAAIRACPEQAISSRDR
jgi:ferredoxin